ncbi:MAG: alkaline phosphatase family protein, partial [Bacteroidales bacterium]|nr:alkaline phosphatase family protein [Candidatus Sodaliphilus fimicaballi]
MKKLFFLILMLATAVSALAAGRDSYTVVVSLDGFRWDYVDAYDTHFLSWLGRSGVKAVMTPSFPSKTFPNHYTLATGLVPDHHGIIGNQFKVAKTGRVFKLGNDVARDGKKYGGDPLWLTAKHQGVTSATVYWVGSDVAVQGDHANYWRDYAQKPLLTLPERVHEVIKLLKKPEGKRPHLVMAYFEQPDSYGHEFGPISRPTRRAMEYMDSLMQVLYTGLMELPIAADINFIVTGDHGMTYLSPERVVPIKKYIKSSWVDEICNDFPTLIYCKKPEYVDSVMNALKDVDHLRVWRKGQLPEYLQYGNNENMGDVIV